MVTSVPSIRGWGGGALRGKPCSIHVQKAMRESPPAFSRATGGFQQPGRGAAGKLWKELIGAWGGLVGRGLSNKSMRGGNIFAASAPGQMHRGLGALGSRCPLAEPVPSAAGTGTAPSRGGGGELGRLPHAVRARVTPTCAELGVGARSHPRWAPVPILSPHCRWAPLLAGECDNKPPPPPPPPPAPIPSVPLAERFANIFLSSSSPFHK